MQTYVARFPGNSRVAIKTVVNQYPTNLETRGIATIKELEATIATLKAPANLLITQIFSNRKVGSFRQVTSNINQKNTEENSFPG